MRLPRLYVDHPLYPGEGLILPPAQARHAIQVLRLKKDDPLVLFNGDGRDYPARILSVRHLEVWAHIESMTEPEPQPPLSIHLALGISRGERMDLALQKAVELGVNRITPLVTRRVQVQLTGERLNKRLAHWRGVIIAACEQSGRRLMPRLEPVTDLGPWLRQQPGGWLLDPQGERALARMPAPKGDLTLLVGPEGGLEPAERELAKGCGFVGVRLGPRILRTETAPLAAIAAIQALWGDFGV